MSEIADRIQSNARRSSEFVDGVVLSDASIEQIIQSENGYIEEINNLNARLSKMGKSSIVWHRTLMKNLSLHMSTRKTSP